MLRLLTRLSSGKVSYLGQAWQPGSLQYAYEEPPSMSHHPKGLPKNLEWLLWQKLNCAFFMIIFF